MDRTVWLLLVTLAGLGVACRGDRTGEPGQAANSEVAESKAPPSRVVAHSFLSWGTNGPLAFPARLAYCDSPRDCRAIAIFFSPSRALSAELSPDGRYVFFTFTRDEEQADARRVSLHVYDRGADDIIGRYTRLNKGVFAWTPSNTLLHTWSAGSDTTILEILTPDGKTLGAIEGPVITLSPCRDRAVAYRTARNPIAEADRLAVYDLTRELPTVTFKKIEGVRDVRSIDWSGSTVEVTYVDSTDVSRSTIIESDIDWCRSESDRRAPLVLPGEDAD